MADTNNIDDFLKYWETEGAAYARAGDYAWMAAQVPEAERVLEISCGAGFWTLALLQRGFSVLAVVMLDACLAAARQMIAGFQPQIMLCWLMGAPQETTGATSKKNRETLEAVAAYREKTYRQAKDLGRDTLARYHLSKTFADLPFDATRQDALYRRLAGQEKEAVRLQREMGHAHLALKSIVPVLGSLVARRRTT
jgi:hypothetical protein